MTTPLRIAVVGVGRWGQRILATLHTMPTVCCVVATATRDYGRVIDPSAVDGVVIATPAHTHAAIAESFLSAGIPVFIEKPFTTSVADAEHLAALSVAHDASIVVGHIDLSNDAYRAAKAQLPTIGVLTHLFVEGGGNGTAREDVSILWDWTPHSAAMVLDILSEFPSQIQATGTPPAFPTSVTLDLTFPNGVTAHIVNDYAWPERRRRLTAYGTHGTVTYDDARDTKTTPPLTTEMVEWLATLRAHRHTDVTLPRNVVRVLCTADRLLYSSPKPMRI